MLQWIEKIKSNKDRRNVDYDYFQEWKEIFISSNDFDQKIQHENDETKWIISNYYQVS